MRTLILAASILAAGLARAGECPSFTLAKPVWPAGRASKVNDNVSFKATFDAAKAAKTVLRVTGSSAYRIRLNGTFAGYGPARGPKGYFRVDEWPLAVADGRNLLEIEVAGYNCSSYYLQDQQSFLQAEVLVDGKVVVASSRDGGFAAFPTDRVRKVPRFSYQRPFAEAYRVGSSSGASAIALEERPQMPLLPRIAPFPSFAVNSSVRAISVADAKTDAARKMRPRRSLVWDPNIPELTTFHAEEIEVDLLGDGNKVTYSDRKPVSGLAELQLTDSNSFVIDAGLNDCGFSGMTVEVKRPGRLILTFDEILSEDGSVNAERMGCCNVVEWIFERPGRYDIETFEPYVWRYAGLRTPDGEMRVSDLHVRAYKNSQTGRASFRASDPALEKIFAAAKETFAQNAVDVFTDCPSRERAGWLCDSFFIGRVNRAITGNTDLERLFLQNFLLPESFECLPQGMLPMCYPSDHRNGNFIPNWAMWFVIETEEYLARSGDRAMIDALRPRLVALIDYLKKFRNADGLLEKLPRWVFVEWSRANALVQDVNYPSNMTWAEVLDIMNRLYDMPELAVEAERVREAVRRQSWTGKWFCDNAVRQKDGTLKLSGECTETCQYYAFFFKTATPKSHPQLWNTLVSDFGPKRLAADQKTLKSHKDIPLSNAFIGNYLRLECLAREGLSANIFEETKGFFLYMAERTGTLWENISTCASCDHGFASHAAITLYRDILGVREIDYLRRTVRIAPSEDLPLQFCEGTLPVSPSEAVEVAWKRGADNKIVVDVKLPDGWKRR